MNIALDRLAYTFRNKPLVVGGRAKEYYGIRTSGPDIDLIVTPVDYDALALLYPHACVDLYGDLGVKVKGFEIWRTIVSLGYDELSVGAIEIDGYRVISLEKLLFLTALGIKKPKYRKDLELIVEKILALRYKDFDHSRYTGNV